MILLIYISNLNRNMFYYIYLYNYNNYDILYLKEYY